MNKNAAIVGSIEYILNKKIERRVLDNFDYTLRAPEIADNREKRRLPRRHGTRNRMAAFANITEK